MARVKKDRRNSASGVSERLGTIRTEEVKVSNLFLLGKMRAAAAPSDDGCPLIDHDRFAAATSRTKQRQPRRMLKIPEHEATQNPERSRRELMLFKK